MNLPSNTAPVASIGPSNLAAIQRRAGWRTLPLDLHGLRSRSQLDQEIAGQVFRFDFAALLPPESRSQLDQEIAGQVFRFDFAALLPPEPTAPMRPT